MNKKILIVDDHKSVGEGYKRWLEVDGYSVSVFSSIDKNFLKEIHSQKPNLILMDIDLNNKEIDGFKLSSELSRKYPDIKIIFCTHYSDCETIKKAFESGGSGFFSKSDELKFLKEGIERVLEGFLYLSPSAIKKIINYLIEKKVIIKQEAIKNNHNLTAKETMILNYISEGLTNKEIAQKIATNEKNVKNIIAAILVKLEAKNRAHAVKKAMECALLSSP